MIIFKLLLSVFYLTINAQEILRESQKQFSQLFKEEYQETLHSPPTLPFYEFRRIGSPTHYLLGTLHNIPEKFLPSFIKETIFSTDIVITEKMKTSENAYTELGDFADVLFEEIKQAGLVWDEEIDWSALISDTHYRKIEDGLNPTLKKAWNHTIKELHPILIYELIRMNIQMRDNALLYSHKTSIDEFILQQLQQQNKIIMRLETPKDRLEAAGTFNKLIEGKNNIDVGDICKAINDLLDQNTLKSYNLDATIEEYKKLIKIYLKGDVDHLSAYVTEFTEKRNMIWQDHLREIFKEHPNKSMTLLVGAAHLVGDSGMLKFLKKEGFEVRLCTYN